MRRGTVSRTVQRLRRVLDQVESEDNATMDYLRGEVDRLEDEVEGLKHALSLCQKGQAKA